MDHRIDAATYACSGFDGFDPAARLKCVVHAVNSCVTIAGLQKARASDQAKIAELDKDNAAWIDACAQQKATILELEGRYHEAVKTIATERLKHEGVVAELRSRHEMLRSGLESNNRVCSERARTIAALEARINSITLSNGTLVREHEGVVAELNKRLDERLNRIAELSSALNSANESVRSIKVELGMLHIAYHDRLQIIADQEGTLAANRKTTSLLEGRIESLVNEQRNLNKARGELMGRLRRLDPSRVQELEQRNAELFGQLLELKASLPSGDPEVAKLKNELAAAKENCNRFSGLLDENTRAFFDLAKAGEVKNKRIRELEMALVERESELKGSKCHFDNCDSKIKELSTRVRSLESAYDELNSRHMKALEFIASNIKA